MINKINKLALTHPSLTTTSLVIVIVALQQLASMLITTLFVDASKDSFGLYIRYVASAVIVFLLWEWNALKDSGVTQPMSQWHAKWLLSLFPMLIIGGLNVAGVQWGDAEFTTSKVIQWIFDNLATGLFEEIMMRGMAFYLLYRAWKHENNGIYKAAVTQALIFGLLHLINLRDGFSIDVIAQVTYATILGFAFAGIVAFCQSIWPAVIAHAYINAISDINPTFVTSYVDTSQPVQMYIVFISIILVVTAVPGYFMLRSSARSLELARNC